MFLDDPRISSVIFYPRKHTEPRNLDPSIAQILKFQIDDQVMIGGFYFNNDPNLPTILLFHGNGELAFEYQYFTKPFFECGVNLAVVDFRGYGFSSGQPVFSNLFTDTFPVYEQFKDWMKEQNLNDSLFILGRSLGSTCAAEIGSRNPPELKGVIFESGIGSATQIMTALFGVNIPKETLDEVKEWSNDTKAAKIQKPVLIIHGTSDWIVPSKHGKILYDALSEKIEKQLVLIENAGHNNIFQFQDQYFTPLKEFIDKFKGQ